LAFTRLPNHQLARVTQSARIIAMYELGLTIKALAIRMDKREVKYVLGADLEARVDLDIAHGGQRAQISSSGGVRIGCVFVRHASALFFVSLASFVLQGLERRNE